MMMPRNPSTAMAVMKTIRRTITRRILSQNEGGSGQITAVNPVHDRKGKPVDRNQGPAGRPHSVRSQADGEETRTRHASFGRTLPCDPLSIRQGDYHRLVLWG